VLARRHGINPNVTSTRGCEKYKRACDKKLAPAKEQINLTVKFVHIRDQHDRDALRLRVHTGSRDSQEDAASNEESNNSSEAVD
jgi:hypothetical protein